MFDGRIVGQCKCCFSRFRQISFMFRNVIFHNSWKVTPVAPRNAHDVSYVARIKHVSHFAWQGQHLVTLECFFCGMLECHFSSQA